MGWYAVEKIDEALEETKDLLLPFDAGTWAKLLLIVALTGGSGMPSAPTGSGQGTTTDSYTGPGYQTPTSPFRTSITHDTQYIHSNLPGTAPLPPIGTAALAAIVIVFIVLATLFLLIDSVFEFIYYQSLLDKEVAIRKNFRKHIYRGLRYFGFRLTAAVIILAGLLAALAPMQAAPALGAMLVFTWLVALLIFSIFMGLTHNFVLLKMMETGEGVIASWRLLLEDLRGQWKQVAVYLVARFFIKVAGGLITLVWAVITLLVFGIVFFIPGALAYFLWPPLAIPVVVTAILVWLVAAAAVRVPVQTYIYYYAILVYHDLTSAPEAEKHRAEHEQEEGEGEDGDNGEVE